MTSFLLLTAGGTTEAGILVENASMGITGAVMIGVISASVGATELGDMRIDLYKKELSCRRIVPSIPLPPKSKLGLWRSLLKLMGW